MRKIDWETMAVAACLSRGAARKAIMDEMVRKYRKHHSLKAARSMAARAVRRAWTRGRRNAVRAAQTAYEIASGVRAVKIPNPNIIVRKRVSSRGRVSYVARPLRTVLVDSARAIWARHRDNPLFRSRWIQTKESAFIRAYCAEMQRFSGYVSPDRAALVYFDVVGAVRVPLKTPDYVKIYKPGEMSPMFRGDFCPKLEKPQKTTKVSFNLPETVPIALNHCTRKTGVPIIDEMLMTFDAIRVDAPTFDGGFPLGACESIRKPVSNYNVSIGTWTTTRSHAATYGVDCDAHNDAPPDRQEHLAPTIVQPIWRESRALADDAKHIMHAQRAYYRDRKRGVIPAAWIVDALDRAEIDRTCGYRSTATSRRLQLTLI